MGIENSNAVDAIGIENATGMAVLSLLVGSDWTDERETLHAFQNKLNAYFAFIESAEIYEAYPSARGRPLRIDVLWRTAPPPRAITLIEKARIAAKPIGVEITARVA
jgi:hypothetical protein